jgi:hypothetical protein
MQAYDWALETSKYMSRLKADDAQTPEQILKVQKHVQQYLMAHPPIAEDHFTEMMQLARKLSNEKLLEQAKASIAWSVSRKCVKARVWEIVCLATSACNTMAVSWLRRLVINFPL